MTTPKLLSRDELETCRDVATTQGARWAPAAVLKLLDHISALEADLGAHREANATASCAFCEWCQKLPGSQDARKAALAAHVKECPSHPMRALEADNAALLRAWHEAYDHNNFRPGEDIAGMPHPGAALLEELERAKRALGEFQEELLGERPVGLMLESAKEAIHKALIRARNEGREDAAKLLDARAEEHRRFAKACPSMAGPLAADAIREESIAACIRAMMEPEHEG